MTDAFNSNITAGPQKTRFLLLLVSLVALIVLEPFIYDYIHINFLVDIFFSFITLTTLGYGDITPLSNPAKSLVMLEAIVGQMYIAVLIARLVGIHISQGLMKQ